MTLEDVQELMDAMQWSRTRLAAELELTGNAIEKWFQAGRIPGGPTTILLRDWLIRARQGQPLRAVESKRKAAAV